jgi:hypothetical protein
VHGFAALGFDNDLVIFPLDHGIDIPRLQTTIHHLTAMLLAQ